MNLLSINNLAKIGREEPLFSGVTFGLNLGDKAAVIGRNGTGKSTLLATIAGQLVPDEGTVVLNKQAGVSYLPQDPQFEPQNTIREHIFASKSAKLQIIREYQDICAQLGRQHEEAVQKRYDELMLLMDQKDLWNYESQISSILSTLGITDMTRRMGSLSGGMIKKVALAQVLVEDTKLLLLDEPTNHLDISTISWLQDYLRTTDRSVLMVTHDRYFLDNVCNNIYEIDHHRIKLYQGNYSSYLEKKETEIQVAQNTDRRIEAVLRVERDWLMRGPCARGTKAKARIQRDMQLINREKFAEDKGFTFEVKGRRQGGKILELHRICKNFPKGYAGEAESAGNTMPVLKDFSYTFSKGQKIGIFGDNGTGKSTLLNIITGAIPPDSGTVVTGETTVFAYYQQNPVFKDTSLSVLEYVKEAADIITMNNGKSYSASQFLDEFGFSGKIQVSPVSTLSGGERKRLFLVRLLISNPNFLILDEPTNDFDIFTINILEQFLSGFSGCLLVVSHDRYFMDKTTDSLFILEDDGGVSGFAGSCSDYLEYRKERAEQAAAASKEAAKAASKAAEKQDHAAQGAASAAAPQQKKKLTFKEQKEFEQLEAAIARNESRKTQLESQMSDASTDYSKLGALNESYTALTAELERQYGRWEELASKL